MVHSLVCYYALQGMQDLAAWIVNDHTDLGSEVCTRRMFGFFTKQEMARLLAKETEVESYLEQVDGNLKLLRDEVSKLYSELL